VTVLRLTTDGEHAVPTATNLLSPEFTQALPNPPWTSDIAHFPSDEKGLHLAAARALFCRRAVGWHKKLARSDGCQRGSSRVIVARLLGRA
jgi:hypothetical protein